MSDNANVRSRRPKSKHLLHVTKRVSDATAWDAIPDWASAACRLLRSRGRMSEWELTRHLPSRGAPLLLLLQWQLVELMGETARLGYLLSNRGYALLEYLDAKPFITCLQSISRPRSARQEIEQAEVQEAEITEEAAIA